MRAYVTDEYLFHSVPVRILIWTRGFASIMVPGPRIKQSSQARQIMRVTFVSRKRRLSQRSPRHPLPIRTTRRPTGDWNAWTELQFLCLKTACVCRLASTHDASGRLPNYFKEKARATYVFPPALRDSPLMRACAKLRNVSTTHFVLSAPRMVTKQGIKLGVSRKGHAMPGSDSATKGGSR